MMFILSFNGGQWCGKYWFIYLNVVGEIDSEGFLFRVGLPRLLEISYISISFSVISGLLLGCTLTRLWSNHRWHSPRMVHSLARDISERFVSEREIKSSIYAWPARKYHYDSYRNDAKTLICDVTLAITEQVKYLRSLHPEINLSFDNEMKYSPILQVCPFWFSGAIRELLLNAVMHNRKNKQLVIKVNSSVQANHLVVCVADNGVGLAGKITNNLKFISCATDEGAIATTLGNEDPFNLASIKCRLNQLKGSLEVVTARHFSTKIILNIPLIETIEGAHSEHYKTPTKCIDLIQNPNLPTLLLISQQEQILSGNMHLLSECFNLLFATSVKQGIDIAHCHSPNCVLLDKKSVELDSIYTYSGQEPRNEFADLPIIIIENEYTIDSLSTTLPSGMSIINIERSNAREIVLAIKHVVYEKQKVFEQVSEGIANYHLRLAMTNKVTEQEGSKFMDSFTLLLKEHYTNEKFSRPTAAKLMLMTEKTLTRRLTQHYELGFAEKLRQFRLHEGRELLLNGAKVTTAAYDSGFSSPSYFARCFRKEFGFAPSKLNNMR